MNSAPVIQELFKNKDVFKELLTGLTEKEYLWKPNPDKWCLLEVLCHLYDEEREDFRARIKHVLEIPAQPLPSIDPPGWVQQREYIKQNYAGKLDMFLKERENSVEWLRSLRSPHVGQCLRAS